VLVDEDVLRADVAVHDAERLSERIGLVVRVVERLAHLARHRDRVGVAEPLTPCTPLESTCASEGPSTYSIAMKKWPSMLPNSKTWAMFACTRLMEMRASLSSISRNSSDPACCARMR